MPIPGPRGHLGRSPNFAQCVLAALLAGCAAPPDSAPAAPATLSPRTACASLAGQSIPAAAIGLPTRGATIATAVLVAPSPAAWNASTGLHIGALPEHCRVQGAIAPIDPKAPAIQFQANLPTRWNQKALQVGGGGLNGSIPANLAAYVRGGSPVSAAHPPGTPYPLSQGYATFGGDSGHQGEAGDWALNAEAWTNFGHAALKKTHDAAFAVIEALYGARPRYSYFMGSSQGGREALEVTQRYPDDYDGVVATVPLIGYTSHVVAKTLYATLQTGGGWISPLKSRLIGAEVLRQCDALDGIADGVISHYQACNALFDPAVTPAPYSRIRCAGGADAGPSCLSDAQIATANRMHASLQFGFELANGLRDFPGYGTGREGTAWLNITPQPGLPARPSLGQPGTTVQYGILQDPQLNLLDFSIAAYRDRIQAASLIIDSTNPDLSRFFARGGRLIIKSSASDYAVNPRALARYHDAVVARNGQSRVDAHLRYYVLPATGHSGDGVSATSGEPVPHHIDLFAMVTDWVERGVAPPDAPVLRAMSAAPPFSVSATKPMCRYPLYPRYRGSGDAKQAASYVCTEY